MKRMTIPEIQQVSMGILRHVDAFCKVRNIRYWLDSGTLIGAVRDKSLIPWDDDIDIGMPRPDFDRFVKEYEDCEKYKLYDSSRGNSYLTYARMCEMKDTYFKQNSVWTEEEPGVGIDIFPIDGAPSEVKTFDRHVGKLVKIRNKLWALRRAHSPCLKFEFRKDPIGFAKDVVHLIARQRMRQTFAKSVFRLLNEDRQLRMSCPYESADHCFIMATTYDHRMYWDKSWFRESIEVEIDGEMFPAPVDVDPRLRAEYGDYMTPPQADNQQDHNSVQSMWWK